MGRINAIFAADIRGGMGNKGTMPWPHKSDDLAWFKEHTEGQIVIMGRRTWDDPAMPKPLPNRISCIFTNRFINMPSVYCLKGDYTKQVLKVQAEFPNRNIFIIGGSALLEETRPLVERVYFTLIRDSFKTDCRININAYLQGLKCESVKPGDGCTFSIYKNETIPQ